MRNKENSEIFLFTCLCPEKAHQNSREWTLCAAQAYFEKQGILMPALRYADSGKPYFDRSEHFLSVTHSDRFFAAAFAPFPIGIDAESESEARARIAARYFTEREKQMPFSLVWTAKEAVSKISGKGLGIVSKIHVESEKSARMGEERFFLSSRTVDTFRLTLAWQEEQTERASCRKNGSRKTIRDLSV